MNQHTPGKTCCYWSIDRDTGTKTTCGPIVYVFSSQVPGWSNDASFIASDGQWYYCHDHGRIALAAGGTGHLIGHPVNMRTILFGKEAD